MRWHELFHVCDGTWSTIPECPGCGSFFVLDPQDGPTSCPCSAELWVEWRGGFWRIHRVDGPDATFEGAVYETAVVRGLGAFLATRTGWASPVGRGLEAAAHEHSP